MPIPEPFTGKGFINYGSVQVYENERFLFEGVQATGSFRRRSI